MGCTTSTVSPNKAYTSHGPSGSDNALRVSSRKMAPDETSLVYAEAVDNSSNLFASIKRGDLANFLMLLTHYQTNDGELSPNGTRINKNVNNLLGMWNSTPLIVAAQYGQNEMAKLLMNETNLGDLNHRNEKGASALLYACMEGLTDIVKELLSKNVEISLIPASDSLYNQAADQSVRCTPYSIAIVNGHQTIVAMLIEAGMELNLHFEFPTLKSVLKPATIAAINAAEPTPPSPLGLKISSQCSETSVSFSGAGASATPISTALPVRAGASTLRGVLFVTPILLAAASGKLNVFRELLWRGADCSITDAEGSTVLHHIARSKTDAANMIRELKKNNKLNDALLDVKDKNGDTALIVACEGKQMEVLQLLLEEGGSTSQCNTITGTSALHIAVKKRSIEIVNLLLEYGADPLLVDKSKVSALDLAMKLHSDSEIHKAMLAAGDAWRLLRSQRPAPDSYASTLDTSSTSTVAINTTHSNDIPSTTLVSPAKGDSTTKSTIPTKVNNYTTSDTTTTTTTTTITSPTPTPTSTTYTAPATPQTQAANTTSNLSVNTSSPKSNMADCVQVYDSPEHIRDAENTRSPVHTKKINTVNNSAKNNSSAKNANNKTSPIPGTSKTATTPSKSTTTSTTASKENKVLEHLGRRATEFQAELAAEEEALVDSNRNNGRNSYPNPSLDSPSLHLSANHTPNNNTQVDAEKEYNRLQRKLRRGSVLTDEEEKLLVDAENEAVDQGSVGGDGDFDLTILGTPMSQSSPVRVPRHTPTAPSPPAFFSSSAASSAKSITTPVSSLGGIAAAAAAPTGTAAATQAANLYRNTGSFQSPVQIPKKEVTVLGANTSDKVPPLSPRKASVKDGSFKSPYNSLVSGAVPATGSIKAKISNNGGDVVSVDASKVPSSSVLGDVLPPVSVVAVVEEATQQAQQSSPTASSSGVDANASYATPRKASVEKSAAAGARGSHPVASAQTAVKPTVSTPTHGSTLESKTSFVPRKPSDGPSQTNALRNNRFSARAAASTTASSVDPATTAVPVRNIIASPPVKPVAETKAFRRGPSSDNV